MSSATEIFTSGGDIYDMIAARLRGETQPDAATTTGPGPCTAVSSAAGGPGAGGTSLNQHPRTSEGGSSVRYKRVCARKRCGKEFETGDSRKLYCSFDCQTRAGSERECARARAKSAQRRYLASLKARPFGVVNDPFISGWFADGLPGLHAMITPLEGMYSQPEPKEAQK